MNKMKLLLLAFLCYSCSKRNHDKGESESMHLDVIYRIPSAHFPMTIGCPNAAFPVPEKKNGMFYNLRITDKKIVNAFYEKYKNLKNDPQGETYFDTKAQVYFHIENRVDTLCMNNFGQTLLNGVPQKDNPDLYAVIEDTIYQNYDMLWRSDRMK